MSLINREALYEKARDLEAQALSYVAKIANDKTKIEEWKIWSAILIERTGFKHDIFDAPEELPSAQPDNSCNGCKYENADDGVLVPCGFCKRSHPDNYERRTDG